MSFDLDLSRGGWSGTRDWFVGLTVWQKLIFLILALPAWLFMMYCIMIGENKSTAAGVAFAIFAGAALLLHLVRRRRDPPGL